MSLQEIIEAVQTANEGTINGLFFKLLPFCEEQSELILTSLSEKMIQFLLNSKTTESIQSQIAEVMYACCNGNQANLSFLIEQPQLLHALLPLCRLIQTKVIPLLIALFIQSGQIFTDYVSKNPHSVSILLDIAARTQDTDAGELVLRLFCSTNTVSEAIAKQVKPLLRDFPASCTLGIMIHSAGMQSVIPEEDFEEWYYTKTYVIPFDVKSSIMLYPAFWEKEAGLKFLLNTAPPVELQHIDWIATKKQSLIDASPEIAQRASDHLLHPETAETAGGPQKSWEGKRSKEGFIYVRLFVLSHCNPKDVPFDARSAVSELIEHPCEYVAAAAMQVLATWSIRFGYDAGQHSAFAAAACAFSDSKSDGIKRIAATSVRAMAASSKTAKGVAEDPAFELTANDRRVVTRAKFCLPAFAPIFDKARDVKLVTRQQLLSTIGGVANTLGFDFAKM